MRSLRPDESRAVLIGVAEYPEDGVFASVEEALHNVLRLKGLLTDPRYAGFHRTREYTRTLINPYTNEGIRAAVKRAAEEATDVLFVYYVGHGSRVGAERELYLTTCTTSSADSVGTTGLRYSVLRDLLRAAQARVVVLVLDCCFSGIAAKVLGNESGDALAKDELLDEAAVEEDVIEGSIDGICVLASSGPTQTSDASDAAGKTDFTAFTGSVVTVLEKKDGDTTPLLLGELFRRVEQRMKRSSVGHQPVMATVGAAGNLVMRRAAQPPPEATSGAAPMPLAPTGSSDTASVTQPATELSPKRLLSWRANESLTLDIYDPRYADQVMRMLKRAILDSPQSDTVLETDTPQAPETDPLW
ncbi:caspase family protein [Streptomyces sp. NPDC088921]|uniref:caspase family protein n=1 Tax=unclassified Streptomyces TaxID=2593676 RepID=UPI0034402C82